MRQLRQRHAAGVAAHDDVHFFIGRQLFDGVDAHLGVLRFIGHHIGQLAAHHAALGVDFIDGNLGRFLRVSAHLQLNRCGQANFEGGLLGLGRQHAGPNANGRQGRDKGSLGVGKNSHECLLD